MQRAILSTRKRTVAGARSARSRCTAIPKPLSYCNLLSQRSTCRLNVLPEMVSQSQIIGVRTIVGLVLDVPLKRNASRQFAVAASLFALSFAELCAGPRAAEAITRLQATEVRTAEKWLAAPSLRLADTAVSYRRVSARALAARRKEEARKFAARIKRRQGRQYARRKAQFKKQQIRLAGQRREMRLKKAMAKARQFAAARRHVALNMPRQPAR